jgi:transposase
VRIWLAVGRTDMRRGMNSLALQVQEALGRDPHAGDLYAFRGVRGDLIKILWHDGIGMSLYAKRLEKGRFIWPSPAHALILRQRAELEAATARASGAEAMIAHLKLTIAKLKRERLGQSAECSRRLDQMELELEELEAVRAGVIFPRSAV